MALHERGCDAISFTGSQSGILTNDRHSGARIIEVRPVRIEDELERGKVVIVAGFQGMSYRREVTTLGRGGSDTTAVALAAALGAEACEIYSDVDGVYSADPRVVPDARRIDHLGYEEMQELAEHGAKVLNAQAVEWAKKAGIVIHARATSSAPAGPVTQTRVGAGAPSTTPREQRGPVAVTGTRSLVCITGDEAVIARALALLAEHSVVLRSAGPSVVRLVRDDVPDWPRIAAALAASGAKISDSDGAVTLIGPGVGSDAALLTRVLEAARASNLISYEASPLRVTLYVPTTEVDTLTQKLHSLITA
jgi:aspartate kinase